MSSEFTKHEIKIDLPGLLQMLGSNIYSEPEACIREMIQNAHDTCIRRQKEDPEFKRPSIDISFDRTKGALIFEDNGAGLTEKEIHEYLSTIGKGYTEELRKAWMSDDRAAAQSLIGQFGIGLLSAFAVGKRLEITTRSYKSDGEGLQWVCNGNIHYSLSRVEKQTVGTRVVIYVSDKNWGILNEESLRKTIKLYADLLTIPIYLTGGAAPVNTMIPPWNRRSSIHEYVKYIQERFGAPPLEIIPINVDDEVTVHGLLYVPLASMLSIGEYGNVDIYISRMFVTENYKFLLPPWAKFVTGVIDCPSLIPTLSRDSVVKDKNYYKVQNLLGKIILTHLEKLRQTNVPKLQQIVDIHNNLIKTWALESDDFFDKIADLVLVDTDQGKMPIQEYLQNSGSSRIYYFSEIGSGTQQRVLFQAKNLSVIDASSGGEESFLRKYVQKHPELELQKLEAGADFIFESIEDSDNTWRMLEEQYKALKIHAQAMAFDPPQVPAVIVRRARSDSDRLLDNILRTYTGESEHLGRLFETLRAEQTKKTNDNDVRDDEILHLNIRNQTIQRLRGMDPRSDIFQTSLIVIYNNAYLFERHAVTPENALQIYEGVNRAVTLLIDKTIEVTKFTDQFVKAEKELEILRQQLKPASLYEYRSCFFARPFKEGFPEIEDEVRTYFKDKGLGIELLSAAQDLTSLDVMKNVHEQMRKCHFGIADITGNNPSVLYEVGWMLGHGKQVILLKYDKDATDTAFDIDHQLRILYGKYTLASGQTEIAGLRKGLEPAIKYILNTCIELEEAKYWDSS